MGGRMREVRNKRIEIRLTESERRMLLRRSGKMDVSKYIRQQIFMHEADRIVLDRNIEQELRRLNIEINRIGVNINQIAHNHNSGIYSEQDLWYLIRDMEKIQKILESYRVILNGKLWTKGAE